MFELVSSSLPPIWECGDVEWMNSVLNHPAVRPYIGSPEKGALDIRKSVGDPNVYLVAGEHAFEIAVRLMTGVFEVHSNCLPSGRGEWMVNFLHAAAQWLYCNTEAYEIVTFIPERHLPAKAVAIRGGLMPEFVADQPYEHRGRAGSATVHSCRIQDWAAKAPEMVEIGRAHSIHWKHLSEGRLRYTGVLYRMMLGGQTKKGVNLYNRWVLASHLPRTELAEMVSETQVRLAHVVIDLEDE